MFGLLKMIPTNLILIVAALATIGFLGYTIVSTKQRLTETKIKLEQTIQESNRIITQLNNTIRNLEELSNTIDDIEQQTDESVREINRSLSDKSDVQALEGRANGIINGLFNQIQSESSR